MNINNHRSCFAALAASTALKKVCDDNLNSFLNYFNFQASLTITGVWSIPLFHLFSLPSIF